VLKTTPPSAAVSAAAILNDDNAPAPGSYSYYLAGGLIRLGSPPAGQITADVTAGAAAADRTAAQAWVDVLGFADYSAGDWSALDVTELDADTSAVIGYWSGTEPTTCADVATALAGSVGAWWGVNRDGVFRIQRLEDPASGVPILTLTADDLKRPLERVPTADEGRGLPVWRSVMRYARNYTVQNTVAGGVTDAQRSEYAQAWREESAEDTDVQTAYLLAREQITDTLLTTSAAASAEAARRLALRSARRDRMTFGLALDATTNRLDLGDIIRLEHPRFGLSGGKNFVVLGLGLDTANRLLTLQVWG
jgi:hypothetical protein